MPSARRRRAALALSAAVVVWAACGGGPGAAATGSVASASADDGLATLATREAWGWPVAAPFRVDGPYVAPAHEYGPGHRGVDVLALGATVVRAPAGGIVAFAGSVAGRGIVTIDHGDGLVSTLEPVDPAVEEGIQVDRGEAVGALSVGGHATPGRVHLGARWNGEYVNPLLLLGGVPRAVLLPCCD